MKKYLTPLLLLCAAAALILDSRCAADSVREAVELCMKTLIPGLLPLFVVSAMAVPHLRAVRIPGLSKLLGLPRGCEGMYILGSAGGFPVGAVCIAQMVRSGALSKRNAQRMLGLCSNCGPSFLFGVVAAVVSTEAAVLIFLLQLASSLILGMLWPGKPEEVRLPEVPSVPLTAAVSQSIGSIANVCGWVLLAAVLTGFARRWLFPLLSGPIHVALTGFLEITGGIMALPSLSGDLTLMIGTGIVCFGGVCVLLQIRSVAAEAGIPMGACVLQKSAQALLATALCWAFLRFGPWGVLIPGAGVLCIKIAVEISNPMVYNTRRKEGI